MAALDAYPVATPDGEQIRLDLVRPEALYKLAFNATAGAAIDAAPFVVNGLYNLYATEDCIIDFLVPATNTPSGNSAIFLAAGERVTCVLPLNATGFSAVGTVNSGDLYIQRLTAWAGLSDVTTLENV